MIVKSTIDQAQITTQPPFILSRFRNADADVSGTVGAAVGMTRRLVFLTSFLYSCCHEESKRRAEEQKRRDP